jgi:NADPH2:quinone reductase
MAREATVTGVFLWGLPAPDSAQIRAALQAGLSNGTLLPRVGLELPLASAAEAQRRILEPGAVGKIVLVP